MEHQPAVPVVIMCVDTIYIEEGSMIEIRTLKEEDLPRLSVLLEELSDEQSDPEKMKSGFRRMNDDPAYILLGAFSGGILAGSLMGIVCHDLVGACRPFMVIENVIVAGDYRGKGIGRMLMHSIEEEGRTRNCYYTMFVSGIKRKDAHAFYESTGYEKDMVRGFKKYL
jgi:phosphoglycolate phosphatase